MVADKVNASFLDQQFEVNFNFLEEQLKTAPGVDAGAAKGGLCGKDLTAADMMMSFPIIATTTRGVITKDKYPELVVYAERLQAAEGYKRAVAKVEETDGKFVATL
jgi:glutathione S-transferase